MTASKALEILKEDRPNLTLAEAEHELMCFSSLINLHKDFEAEKEFLKISTQS